LWKLKCSHALATLLTSLDRYFFGYYITLELFAVATRDCNPGLLFQSRDFGIEKCQSRDPGIESRDWVPVWTSKNFL